MDQVHLIVTAELVGDIGPRLCSRPRFVIESRLKSNHSCIQFGPQPESCTKLTFELTLTDSCTRSKVRDTDSTLIRVDEMHHSRKAVRA
jgi:hypothetical protein